MRPCPSVCGRTCPPAVWPAHVRHAGTGGAGVPGAVQNLAATPADSGDRVYAPRPRRR